MPDPVLGFRGIEIPGFGIAADNNSESNQNSGLTSRSILAAVTTYAELESAVAAANAAPGIDHIITVRVGTYSFDPAVGKNFDLRIRANVSVTLQGVTYSNLPAQPDDVVLQRLVSDSRRFSLFRVDATGKLILRNVRLANAGSTSAAFNGGAVRLQSSTTSQAGGWLELYDSRVVGNKVAQKGGGIFVGQNATLFMTNTTFFGNEASEGGAIYAEIGSRVRVRQNDFGTFCAGFQSNRANNGAAVYSNGASTLKIDFSKFKYNTLTGYIGQHP